LYLESSYLQKDLPAGFALTVQTPPAALSEHQFCSYMVRRIFWLKRHRKAFWQTWPFVQASSVKNGRSAVWKGIVSECTGNAPFLLLNYRDTRMVTSQNAKRIVIRLVSWPFSAMINAEA
jgi:hypothetical protein